MKKLREIQYALEDIWRNLRILPCKVFNNWGWANRPAYFVMGIPFLTISYWKANYWRTRE